MGQVLQTEDWAAANRIQSAKLGELGYTSICLAPGEETPGHSHTLVEEVTVFRGGSGEVQIENDCFEVCEGSVSVVPAGEYHSIKNTGSVNLEAVVVFNSNIDRDKVDYKTREQHFADSDPAASSDADGMRGVIASLSETIDRLEQKLNALEK